MCGLLNDVALVKAKGINVVFSSEEAQPGEWLTRHPQRYEPGLAHTPCYVYRSGSVTTHS